jgi:hypothetical protein
MLPHFPVLRCLGKAVVKHAGNAVGFGVLGDVLVDAGEEVRQEWNAEAEALRRRDEMAAVARAAASECRRQVEGVIRQAALVQPMLRQPQPMPSVHVTLTALTGPLAGQVFVFTDRTTCIVGRADDCAPRLPNDDDLNNMAISRHHCLFDINPPDIRVRDFGSRNGTYVNRTLIGQRPEGMTAEDGVRLAFPEHDLQDGDHVMLCNSVFRVGTGLGSCMLAFGAETCERPRCARCGGDVAAQVGPRRRGEFVCAACRGEPHNLAHRLLELGASGDPRVAALRDYHLDRELGRGGMGAVYLARHRKTREPVALKLLLPQVAADPRAREMFLREAENTRALVHPHVVRLRDAGCAEGTFFFILEFCDGGSVDRLVAERGGPMAITQAADILLQVLDGLAYTHTAPVPHVKLADGDFGPGYGLVHRDLKPQNIFLTEGGRVAKIGDYGLAKAFDAAGLSGQTRTGSTAGTPVFMPRQLLVNFKYAGPEVDVWAAAASFYYLVTGQYPRDFPPARDPWHVVLETDPVPIRRRNPNIPPRLAEVIDLALVDRPQIHFKSAAALARELKKVL